MGGVFFIAVAFALSISAALACEGQTGKVIFEDKFTDDGGGWESGESLVLNATGATLKVMASDSEQGYGQTKFNVAFMASQGDFCVEGTFLSNSTQLDPSLGVVFLASDYSNYWFVAATGKGDVVLNRKTNNEWSTIWEVQTNHLIKTGPTDVNSVRAVVKNGTITAIVNGQTVKSVRAQIPSGDLRFGFRGAYGKPSPTPVLFSLRSYKVTAGQ